MPSPAKGTKIILPVCEECGNIAKSHYGHGGIKHACTGPRDAIHKRVAMKPYIFALVGPRDAPAK